MVAAKRLKDQSRGKYIAVSEYCNPGTVERQRYPSSIADTQGQETAFTHLYPIRQ
jgi:hypothetical protein